MADIRLAKPAAGTTQTVPSAPDGRFIFDFPADAATLTRSGDNLVLTFEDGASIQLQDFYTTYSKEEMPSFQVEGVEISGQDFFAALGEDLMPAAGPAAGSSASRSGRYNEYGGSDLLDGLDHLGRLDIGFDGGVQLATDTVEPSPYYEDDHGVTVTPSAPGTDPDDPDIPVQGEDFPPTMPHDVLQVDESALDGGSGGGSATADGSMSVSAPDGVATITIGGVVVWQNGVLTGNPVQTDEGHLDVTGFDGTNLTYTYTLDKATQEHGKEGGGENDAIAHEMEVVVTDRDGDSGSAVIRVEITDDVPTIESFGHDVTEGSSTAINGDALAGSAAGADGADFAWTNPAQQGQYGTITLNEDGTYSYTLDNDNAVVKALSKDETLTEEFTYTYKDADGDVATGSVLITINGVDNGVVVTPSDPSAESEVVTVYESGLDDGSQAGQAGAPTTAEGSLSISAPDGVAGIVIGGVTVFENGALTGNKVSTDEGVLTVTDFDAATGELKFTYELTGNTTEHDGIGMDNVSHDLAVTVTDADGTEEGSTITVTIVDDVPTISAAADAASVKEGDPITGTVDVDFGADGEGYLTLDDQEMSKNAEGKWELTTETGKMVVDVEEGTFTFTPNAGVKDAQDFTFQVYDSDGDPAADAVKVTVDIVDKPGIDLGEDGGRLVTEDAEIAESGKSTDSGSLTVTMENETSVKVTIDRVDQQVSLSDLTAEGGKDIELTEGTLNLKYDTASGKLEYSFVQDTAAVHKNGEALTSEKSYDIDVTFTDNVGQNVNADLTLTIEDDVPSISAQASSEYVKEGDQITGTVDVDFGADGEGYLTLDGEKMTKNPETGKWELTTETGKMVVDVEEGTFTFTPNAGVKDAQDFTFQVYDSDGDPAADAVTVTVDIVDNPSISAESDELVTEDAGTEDGGKSTDSGSLTVTMENETSVKVTIDRVDQQVSLSDLTAEGGKDIELTEGTLNLKYDTASGKLEYSFVQDTAAVHKNGEALTSEKSYDIDVTFTDNVGQNVNADLTLTIEDDVPSISAQASSEYVKEGDQITGTVDVDFGADGEGYLTLDGEKMTKNPETGKWELTTETGKMVVDVENGTFTFTPNAGVKDAQDFTFQVYDSDGDPAADAVTVTVDIVDNPSISAESDELVTEDAGTEDGGKSTDSGSLTVTMENETSVKVTIDRVDQQVSLSDLTAEGGKDIELTEGTLNLKYDTASGKLEYSFVQDTAAVHKNGEALTSEKSYDIDVTFTDNVGQNVNADLTLTIEDDVPSISAQASSEYVKEGDQITGTVDVDFGADGEGYLTLDGEKMTKNPETGKWELTTETGKMVVDVENGTFTFTPNAEVKNAQDFTFQVYDSDGDPAADAVKVTVDIADKPGIDLGEDGGRLVTEDAEIAESGKSTDSGSLTVTMENETSVKVTIDRVDQQVSLSDLTAEGGKDIELTEGTLNLKYDTASGKLEYSFVQDTAAVHKNGEALTSEKSYDIDVTFTDNVGQNVNADLTLTIEDDVPSISAQASSEYVKEGDQITGTVDVDFGADGEGYLTLDGEKMTKNPETGKWELTTETGKMVVDVEEGTFTFTPNAGVKDAQDFTFQVYDSDGDPAADAVTVTVDIVDNPSISAESDELVTEDAGTEDGGKSTDSGSLTVTMENETSVKVTIDRVDQQVSLSDLTAEGGKDIELTEGTLNLKYDTASGKLEYSFVQDTAAVHKNGEALTSEKSYDIDVTFTDNVGQNVNADLTLTIEDDVPSISAQASSEYVKEGDQITGTVDVDFGADGEGYLTLDGEKMTKNPETGKWELTTETGKMVVDVENGTFTFTPNAEVKNAQDFTFQVYDSDGDPAADAVKVTVDIVDKPGIDLGEDGGRLVTEDAEIAESGKSTDSGSLTVTMENETSVKVTIDRVDQQVSLSDLTAEGGKDIELTEGTLNLKYDTASGKLEYSFVQDTAAVHKNGEALTSEKSYDIDVTFTDNVGQNVNADLTLTIEDDVPSISAQASSEYVKEGDQITGTVDVDFGADGEGYLTLDGEKMTKNPETGKWELTTETGKMVVDVENGTFTFTPNAEVKNAQDFTFQVYDSDGDPAADAVKVTVDIVDKPGIDLGEDGGRLVTEDAEIAESGKSTDSGSLTVTMENETSVKVTIDRVDQQVSLSDLTAEGGKNIELTEGTLNLKYDVETGKLDYSFDQDTAAVHKDGEGLTEAKSYDIDVTFTDNVGQNVNADLTLTIKDDVPTISSVDADNDGKPDITFERYPDVDSEDTPLGDGAKADFTQYGTFKDPSGKEHAEEYKDSPIWNGNVTITGGRVQYTYEGVVGEKDPRKVTGVAIIDSNKDLAYSEHIVNPNVADKEQNVGLTVSGKEEISADRSYNENGNFTGVANQSDAIIVTLPEGTVAYGLNLKLGAFFTESSSTEGTKWDTVAEQALLTFYKDGEVVLIYPVTANSADGSYTVPADLVITEGFDKVVISAVDNSWNSDDNFEVEQSDFVVQEIGFVTLPPNEVMFRYEGDLVSDGGADGFADGYTFAFSDKMGESMNVTLGDGETVEAKLTITEGDNGSSILLATVPGADDKTENLFSVTLDADGHWKFDQYQEFSMPDGSDFELGFMTKDNDGDKAYEEVTLITTTETNIGTGGDHAPTSNADVIVNGNSGHDNFVGDPGGATESTQTTYTDLNVALVVDTSGSMDGTRMSETKEALKDLCDQLKEHADEGADVNLSLIGFSGALNINLPVEDITGIEENYRKFTLRDGDTIIGKVGTEFSVTSYVPYDDWSGGQISSTTTYRITEDGTLQRWESGFMGWGGSWEDVRTFSTESLTGYEAVLAQIDDMEAIGGTVYSDGYEAAKDWFGGKTSPDSLQNNGGENIVIFVTDGEPNNEWSAKNAYNQLVAAVDNITVETVGIAITDKDATDLLNGLTTNNNGAHFIEDASKLGDVFGEIVSDITTSTVTPAADDVILGGRGNDMLFGDALNADYLLGKEYTWEGKDTFAKGSSWDIINAYLVATLGHNPSEGEIAKFIAQNADKLGLTDTVADSAGVVRGGDDIILGGSGDDIVYGQGGDDLIFGDGSDTATDATSIGTLDTLDTLLTAAGAGEDGSYAERIRDLGTSETPDQPSELDRFIDSLEGTGGIEKDTDGNDQLFGGAGDDVIFGGSGNDFIDGGEGEDAIFGGAGNDIIVYDNNDYLVSGGSGIDFMVSDDKSLTLSRLLDNSVDDKPLVSGIEVLLKGEDALSLTSLDQLAKDYGITLGTNAEGKETLILDMDKWTKTTDGIYAFNGGAEDGGLTLETNLTPVEASDPASEAVQQQVFTLEHGNG